MGRIRSIKPEFPQSESIGRLSRDARLLFVQIWTLVDDEGRARASSRGLASALYPFDDDVRDLIDGWMMELAREKLVTRYEVDGSTYLVVNNWRKHQKIDRPSKSRLPSFEEASRVFDECSSSPRVTLAADLGSRTVDLGSRIKDQGSVVEQAQPAPSNPEPEEPLGTNWQELTPTDPLSTKGWPKSVDLRIAARFWNQMAGEVGLPEVRALTGERSKHLAARLKDIGSLGEWFASVNAIKDQPFLTGRNDRKWRANFDWFVKPSNFSKVIENTYERSNANGRA
jgi:hypothetical protein